MFAVAFGEIRLEGRANHQLLVVASVFDNQIEEDVTTFVETWPPELVL